MNNIMKKFTSIFLLFVMVLSMPSVLATDDESSSSGGGGGGGGRIASLNHLLDVEDVQSMNFHIKSLDRWLGRNIFWYDSDKAMYGIGGSDDKEIVTVAFEDWVDNDFNDLFVEIHKIDDNSIYIWRKSFETAAPDPAYITLTFDNPTKVTLIKNAGQAEAYQLTEEFYGTVVEVELWESVHESGDKYILKWEAATREELADLVVSDIVTSKAGKDTKIDATIKNIGDVGVTYSRSISLQSTSKSYTKALGTDGIYIGPGETQQYQTYWDLNPGGYEVTVRVDTSAEEYSTDNNKRTEYFNVEQDAFYCDGWNGDFREGETVLVTIDEVDYEIVATYVDNDHTEAKFVVNGEMVDLTVGEGKYLSNKQPIKLNWVANEPETSLLVFRDVKSCADDSLMTNDKDKIHQVIPAGPGIYSNYKCESRKQEQCYDDGTFDMYYDESCSHMTSPAVIQKVHVCFGNGKPDVQLPDLVVTDVGVKPSSPKEGEEVTAYATIKNIGKGTALSTIRTRMEYGDTFITRVESIYSLAPGAQKTIAFESIGSLPQGKHKIDVEVDYLNSVKETNENNNKKAHTFAVGEGQDSNYLAIKISPDFESVKYGETAEYEVYVKDTRTTLEDVITIYNLDVSGLPFKHSELGKIVLGPGRSKTLNLKVYTGHDVDPYAKDSNVVGDASEAVAVAYKKPMDRKGYGFTVIGKRGSETVGKDSATLYVYNYEEPPELPEDSNVKITLHRGWNLVSLPGEFVSFQRLENGNKLLGYIMVDGEYLTLSEAKKELGRKFPKYLSEHSFWIYSYETQPLYAKVKKQTVTVSLDKGWNFIPITYDFPDHSLDFMKNGCGVSSAYMFDSRNQEWDKVKLSYKFSNSDLGKGLVLKSTNSCRFVDFNALNPPKLPEERVVREAVMEDSVRLERTTTQVKGLPDITGEIDVSSGTNPIANVVIRNNGDVTAYNVKWEVTDSLNKRIYGGKIEEIKSGETMVFKSGETFELDELDKGENMVKLYIDIQNKLRESNELNNYDYAKFNAVIATTAAMEG